MSLKVRPMKIVVDYFDIDALRWRSLICSAFIAPGISDESTVLPRPYLSVKSYRCLSLVCDEQRFPLATWDDINMVLVMRKRVVT